MSTAIQTVGHSNRSLAEFLRILDVHAVELLIDVRSVPWSRRWPWFRKQPLADAVRARGLAYLHLGGPLGGRNVTVQPVPEGVFEAALARVLSLARAQRVALMCAEADPARCHRAALLAGPLERRGARVVHVLAADRVEDHTVTAARMAGAPTGTRDLFDP